MHLPGAVVLVYRIVSNLVVYGFIAVSNRGKHQTAFPLFFLSLLFLFFLSPLSLSFFSLSSAIPIPIFLSFVYRRLSIHSIPSTYCIQ